MAFVVQDKYFRKAKELGYRARSAFKLLDVLERFPKFIKVTDNVLDIGAAPGSFMQVIAEKKGIDSILVGVDLQKIEPLQQANVFCIQSDIFSDDLLKIFKERGLEEGAFDVIVSDLAPKTSGIHMVDQMRSIELNERLIGLAKTLLKPRGNLLMKVFVGEDFQKFIHDVRQKFHMVKPFKSQATRDTSSEQYVVCFGFLPQR